MMAPAPPPAAVLTSGGRAAAGGLLGGDEALAEEKNLLVVKGPVPGPNGGDLYMRPAVRLYKSKAHKQAAG